MIHEQTQDLYKQRFEQDQQVNFRDLWEYINKKLSNDGENTLKIQSENPFLQQYLHHITEIDEITQLTQELENIIVEPTTPEDER